MSWNILSQGLCPAERYPETAAADLDAQTRFSRIVMRIKGCIDSSTADHPVVFALQEVSVAAAMDLKRALDEFGYDVVHESHGSSKSGFMGSALLLPRTLEHAQEMVEGTMPHVMRLPEDTPGIKDVLEAGPTSVLGVVVRMASRRDSPFMIATTHLPLLNGRSEAQKVVAKTALEIVRKMASPPTGERYPVVFAGDFNIQPTDEAYRCLTQHLSSVFPGEPFRTVRVAQRSPTGERTVFVGTLDYILHSEEWRCWHPGMHDLSHPSDAVLPNAQEPSDHLLIYATLIPGSRPAGTPPPVPDAMDEVTEPACALHLVWAETVSKDMPSDATDLAMVALRVTGVARCARAFKHTVGHGKETTADFDTFKLDLVQSKPAKLPRDTPVVVACGSISLPMAFFAGLYADHLFPVDQLKGVIGTNHATKSRTFFPVHNASTEESVAEMTALFDVTQLRGTKDAPLVFAIRLPQGPISEKDVEGIRAAVPCADGGVAGVVVIAPTGKNCALGPDNFASVCLAIGIHVRETCQRIPASKYFVTVNGAATLAYMMGRLFSSSNMYGKPGYVNYVAGTYAVINA
jgi:endonuclease/exonuclease/phosphatase family metal-dependent hydrolase